MSMIGNSPVLNLSAATGSFPFQSKYIPLANGTKVVLGSEVQDTASGQTRTATAMNGWFASKPPPSINGVGGGYSTPISPLPLSPSHSEVWLEGQQVYIRDLDSPFGTFVNDAKIKNNTVLRNGDIISLGILIPRNTQTPGHITDEHLKPIIAKVTLIGISPP